MGWKTLKEHFDIDHIVQIEDNFVCIGSGFVSDLVSVNRTTFKVTVNSTFDSSVLRDKALAKLVSSSKEEIKALLEAEDEFSASIPVYTYRGGEIIKKYCEEPGYPNVTHDGELMYENNFSESRDETISTAIKNAEAGINIQMQNIEDSKKELSLLERRLNDRKKDLAKLKTMKLERLPH
jgi:hypothetical protein